MGPASKHHVRNRTGPLIKIFNMFKAFSRGISQLADGATRTIVWRCLAAALAVLVGLWVAVGVLLTETSLFAIPWLDAAVDILGGLATAVITVNKRENVVLVSNAALRFAPTAKETTGRTNSGGLVEMLLPRPPGAGQKSTAETESKGKEQRVWTIRAGAVPPPPSTPTKTGPPP